MSEQELRAALRELAESYLTVGNEISEITATRFNYEPYDPMPVIEDLERLRESMDVLYNKSMEWTK